MMTDETAVQRWHTTFCGCCARAKGERDRYKAALGQIVATLWPGHERLHGDIANDIASVNRAIDLAREALRDAD